MLEVTPLPTNSVALNPAQAYQNLRDSIASHDPVRWQSRFRELEAALERFTKNASGSTYVMVRRTLTVDETDRGIAKDLERHGWVQGVTGKPRTKGLSQGSKWIAYKRRAS